MKASCIIIERHWPISTNH